MYFSNCYRVHSRRCNGRPAEPTPVDNHDTPAIVKNAKNDNTSIVDDLSKWIGFRYAFDFRAILSVLLVTGICGMVGALVVGNRMAFFSDAMAHCTSRGSLSAFF